MRWPLLRSADLTIADVNALLAGAVAFRGGASVAPTGPRCLGLVFLEASLRTRVGFSAAASRLGLSTVEVHEPRSSATSMAESWDDTIRTVAGYSDVIVGRPGQDLGGASPEMHRVRYINGGDHGPAAEHPTQALVDLFAIRTLRKQRARVVTVLGDPTMRAARSLIRLLVRTDHEVLVVTDDQFGHDLPDGSVRADATEALATADVLYVTGIRHESLPLERRSRLLVTAEVMDQLSPSAIVLSPMPVIDEISPKARADRRCRIFEQSDLGLYVRMSILTSALELEIVEP